MPDEDFDNEPRSLSQSLMRRTLIVTQSLEDSLKTVESQQDEINRILLDQRDLLRNLKEQLNNAATEKLFYILLGVSIGLAGRQILKDVINLLVTQ